MALIGASDFAAANPVSAAVVFTFCLDTTDAFRAAGAAIVLVVRFLSVTDGTVFLAGFAVLARVAAEDGFFAAAEACAAVLDNGFATLFAAALPGFWTAALAGAVIGFVLVLVVLAAGFRALLMVLASFSVAVFSIDLAAGFAGAAFLTDVLVAFLIDFVTVAFMVFVLNELPNTLSPLGIACDILLFPHLPGAISFIKIGP